MPETRETYKSKQSIGQWEGALARLRQSLLTQDLLPPESQVDADLLALMREATAQVEDILRRILNRAAMEREITREAVAGQYQTVHGKPPVDAAHVSMLVRQLGSTSSKK